VKVLLLLSGDRPVSETSLNLRLLFRASVGLYSVHTWKICTNVSTLRLAFIAGDLQDAFS
jgi:hypothetical protein